MFDLAMAVIKDLNFTTAAALVAFAVGGAIWLSNRTWAINQRESKAKEHEEKMYQLETERRVKLDVSRITQGDPSKVIEHRIGEE